MKLALHNIPTIQIQKSIVFIDTAVADYKSLIAGIKPGNSVVTLDPNKDGVTQITESLKTAEFKSVHSVHIVSHGSEGCLQLGSSYLNATNLNAYANQLQQWADVLNDDANILLYGCDVASGEGTRFVQQISQLTGVTVTASTDKTGDAALGGNWDLDFSSGKVATSLAFRTEVMEAYNSVLNNPPDLDNSTDPTLPTIGNNISDASNVGVLVADLIKGLISDQDNDNEGIAVTGLTGNGTWQYSLNGGDTWLNFGAVSETRATVLAASTPLYKGSFGGTPNTQGWFQFGSARYNQDLNLTFPFGGGTQTATNGGTNLVTTPEGFAGYSNYNALTTTLLNNAFPVLNRNQGFTLSFDLKINSESNENDRAGFSVLVVTSDKTKAIELGFWSDEIWAQTEPDDGFTRSETEQASRDTTAELTRYDLTIKGDTYSLFAAGEETPIITGSLRDYTGVDELVFTLPYNPYEQPNFIFLGDRTTNAEADVTLSRVELQTNTRVRFVPDSGFEGDATIDFRAWDGTDGKINATTGVDTSNNDGATSFSSDSETARITVNSTINIIIGTDGNDRLYGTAGDDIIYGGAGDDTIYGGAGNDIIYGGAGNDRLYGGDGNDTLYGGDGNDRLYGGDGDDILYGGAGNDRLYGDAGNDHLYGGPGNNLLYGGPGNDRFYFGDNQEFVSANLGVDTIADFVVGNDKIVLSKATFAVLDSILGENDFMVVERDSAAANSNAAIVYNSGNGRLFYNQNRAGSGFGSGAHFATLSRGLNLTAHDFIIQDTIDLGQPVSNYIPDLG